MCGGGGGGADSCNKINEVVICLARASKTFSCKWSKFSCIFCGITRIFYGPESEAGS